MKKVYLAGPLFSLAEKEFNVRLAKELYARLEDIEIILPQERAKLFIHTEDGMKKVFEDCLTMIEQSDVILGVLEGPDADSGTCAELGFAYARKKPIIGLRTDFRASEEKGLNLMLSNICTILIHDASLDSVQLSDEVARAINALI